MTGFGSSGSQVDSARMNLASSFVNGFVNAAFGQDKLLTDDGNKWLYKNKDHGKRQQTHVVSVADGHCPLPAAEILSSQFMVIYYLHFVFQTFLFVYLTNGVFNLIRNVERRSLLGHDPALGCGWWSDPD